MLTFWHLPTDWHCHVPARELALALLVQGAASEINLSLGAIALDGRMNLPQSQAASAAQAGAGNRCRNHLGLEPSY